MKQVMHIVMYNSSPLLFSSEKLARKFFTDRDKDSRRGCLFSTIVDAEPHEVDLYRQGQGNSPLFNLDEPQVAKSW